MSLSVMDRVEDWDLDEADAALQRLRAARRRNRVANVDKFDAFYKAYMTAIFGGLALYAIAGTLGDKAVSVAGLATIRSDGPGYLGVLVAIAIAIGLRSGGRGGPLAFERADVRHVLLAPVDKRDAIRKPAIRSLRHALFLGGAAGGTAGLLALRRLPEHPVAWVACGLAFGAFVAVGSYGAALFACGKRWPRPLTDTIAFAFVLWSLADAYWHLETSPFSWLAHLATWPIDFDPLAFAGAAVMVVLAILGVFFVDGWSLEAAERRSRLVGQLRFAATLQDIRTVMVLQRQLSQEHMRVKPFLKLRAPKRPFNRKGEPSIAVFRHRSLSSLARWPLFRTLRLLVFTAIASASIIGVWAGTTPLVIIAGLSLWLVSMDLLEPLAQETDRPDRLNSMSREPGWVLGRHLVVPLSILFLLVILGSIPAFIVGDSEIVQNLWMPTVVTCTMLPMGAAAITVTRQATFESGVQSAEVAGFLTLWRIFMPPVLAIAGAAPVAIARRDWDVHHDLAHMVQTMTPPWYGLLAVGAWSLAWIRYGQEMKQKMQASQTEAAAAAAKKSEKTEKKA